MGNLGGGELLVILVLGLLVLGPTRLAVVAQEIGRLVGQVRRVAGGFQEELRDLVEDPSIDALARERGQRLVETGSEPEVETGSEPEVETGSEPDLDA
jgi:sec-independent protein translocase protein TatB